MSYDLLVKELERIAPAMEVDVSQTIRNAATAIERLEFNLNDWEAHASLDYDENGTNWGIGGYLCSECHGLCAKGDRFCRHCGARFDRGTRYECRIQY